MVGAVEERELPAQIRCHAGKTVVASRSKITDLSLLIAVSRHQITSGLPTIQELSRFASI